MSVVERAVKAAQSAARGAATVAAQAAQVANAVGQHFWTDTNGAHVTEATREDFETQAQGRNILIGSMGILLRVATTNLVSLTQGATAFYDGVGNLAANVVARFGADGAQIGKDAEAHVVVTDKSMQMDDANGGTYMRIEATDPSTAQTFSFTGNGTAKTFTIASSSQPRTGGAPSCSVTVDGVAVTEGVSFNWTADYLSLIDVVIKVQGVTFEVAPASGASIVLSVASGHRRGFLFGVASSATGVTGDCAVGEGYQPKAGAQAAHAEGVQCIAMGIAAHAEGHGTLAEQPYTHAEGNGSEATAECSHAEGYKCKAEEVNSHAQNTQTIAGSASQTAIGKYNEADFNDVYGLIMGNGTSDSARSNAFAVKWTGDAEYAGAVTASGGQARLNGTAGFVYIRDASANIWRINKGSGGVEFYNGTSWVSMFYNMTTSRTANTVLAAPNGSDGSASFRALVAADIPNIGASKITSGTLALARGGTNSDNSSRTPNTVFAGPSSGTDAGSASWRALVAADIPNLNASKITAGTLARARGGTATDNSARTPNTVLAGPSSGTDTGNCTWRALVEADIPGLNASKITAGTLPISRGGTGNTQTAGTTTASSVITAATNVTITAAHARTWGKVCQLLITAKAGAAKSGTWDVGTTLSPYMPASATFGSSNLAAIEGVRIGTDGAVSCIGTLASGSSVSLTLVFLMAN